MIVKEFNSSAEIQLHYFTNYSEDIIVVNYIRKVQNSKS